MIEKNIIVFSFLFFIIILLFHKGANKYLRPRIIFDPYIFFYLLIASFISIHLFIFYYFDVNDEFIVTFFLSIIAFSIMFFSSSYYFGNKLRIEFKEINNINTGAILKIYDINNFTILFIIFTLFASFVAFDNVEKFMSLSNLHGENAAYLNNNYRSKLTGYFASFLPLSNLYFITYVLMHKNKNAQKNIMALFYFIVILLIFATSPSRASVLYFFMPLGLISFYFSYFNHDKFIQIKKQQIILLFLAVAYAIYLSISGDKNFFEATSEIGRRLYMTSDVALWFHIYGGLSIDMFIEYDLSYYFHVLLKPFGLSGIDSGIGPKIAEMAGSGDFGKGPIPTFFYESYITSKSIIFTVIYSGIVGFLTPYFRYKGIKYFLLLNQNSKNLFIGAIFYFFSTGLTGDFLTFEIAIIVFTSISLMAIFIVKVKIIYNKKLV